MNSYSQKIACISSAHAEDTRILRNFCRERTDWLPFRCITVNNSVNCVEIFPPGRTNHRTASRPALRPCAGLCITPAHAPAAFHALAALSAGLSRSKIPPAAPSGGSAASARSRPRRMHGSRPAASRKAAAPARHYSPQPDAFLYRTGKHRRPSLKNFPLPAAAAAFFLFLPPARRLRARTVQFCLNLP